MMVGLLRKKKLLPERQLNFLLNVRTFPLPLPIIGTPPNNVDFIIQEKFWVFETFSSSSEIDVAFDISFDLSSIDLSELDFDRITMVKREKSDSSWVDLRDISTSFELKDNMLTISGLN